MATYAIGDIQGCYDSLRALLKQCGFDPGLDRLWLVGDLVNRGPKSLEVLRWVRDQGEHATVVLGNHDLHLLAVHAGVDSLRKSDTLATLLDANDADELVEWLGVQPLLVRRDSMIMVHAGLLPGWSSAGAEVAAREAAAALAGEHRNALMARDRSPLMLWSEATGRQRHRLAIAALTRLRMLDDRGHMVKFNKAPGYAPQGLVPWFDHPKRRNGDCTVVFGHWAAMGFLMRDDLIALDSGCVWGGALTAVRLEDRRVFVQPSLEARCGS